MNLHLQRKRSGSLDRSSSSSLNSPRDDRPHSFSHSQPDKAPSPFPLILGSPRSVKSHAASMRPHHWRVPKCRLLNAANGRARLPPRLPGQKDSSNRRASNESLDSSRDIFADGDSDSECIIPSSQMTQITPVPLSTVEETKKKSIEPERALKGPSPQKLSPEKKLGNDEDVPAVSEKGQSTPTRRSKRLAAKEMARVRPFLLHSKVGREDVNSIADGPSEGGPLCSDSIEKSHLYEESTKSTQIDDVHSSPLNCSRESNQPGGEDKTPASESEDPWSADDLTIFENDLTLPEKSSQRGTFMSGEPSGVSDDDDGGSGRGARTPKMSPKKRLSEREPEKDSEGSLVTKRRRRLNNAEEKETESSPSRLDRQLRQTHHKADKALASSSHDSADDLEIFQNEADSFFLDNDVNIFDTSPRKAVDARKNGNKTLMCSEPERDDEEAPDMDKLSLSGDYFRGKSKAIVEKYGLKATNLTNAQLRGRLGRMIRDLRDELSLTDEMIVKLRRLSSKIKLPNIPEQHKVNKLWEDKKGRGRAPYFTESDVSTILRNWKKFRKTYGFKKKHFSLFQPYSYWTKNETLKDTKIRFAQFLAQGLPNRTVKSVYFKFLNLMEQSNSNERCRFTISDDLLILLVDQHFPRNSISILKHIFHLPFNELWGRVQWVKKHHHRTANVETPISRVTDSGRTKRSSSYSHKYDGCKLWSIVTLALSKVLQEFEPSELFDGASTSLDYPAWTRVDEVWSRLSSVTSIPVLALKKIVFTRLLPMAGHYGRIGSRLRRIKHFELKISMVEKLFQERRCSWEEVDWVEVSGYLGGVGPVFIYSLFRKAVKKFVPPDLWFSFQKTIEYMHENALPVYKAASKDDDLYLRMIPQFHSIITSEERKTNRKAGTDSSDEG